MAANEDIGVGVPDPVKHFQDWFKQEIEKREQLNRDLQAELDKCKQQNAELQVQLDARTAEELPSAGYGASKKSEDVRIDDPVSYATYSKLREQQEITWQSLKVTHQAMERYKSKCKKLKDSIRPWQEYAKRCEERAAARSAGVSTPVRDTTLPAIARPSLDTSDFPSSRPSLAGLDTIMKSTKAGHSRSSSATSTVQGKERTPVPKSPSKLHTNVLAVSPEGPGLLPQGPVMQQVAYAYSVEPQQGVPLMTATSPALISRRVSSGLTETTEVHASEEQEHGSNTNRLREEVLRPLGSQRRRAYEGSPAAPIHIKSEPSSSPVIHASETGLARTSTFDLDEVGAHVTTPRKVQKISTFLRGSSSFSKSFPPPGAQVMAAEPRPVAAITIVNFSKSENSRPLQPLSANRNDLPRSAGRSTGAKRRKHHLSEEVVSVTEDGDGIHSRARPISPRKKMKADTTIQGLLGNNTPAKRTLITPMSASTSRPQRDTLRTAAMGIEAEQQTGLVTPSTTSRPPNQAAAPSPAFRAPPKPLETPVTSRRSPRKRVVPLRQRPVTELRPEDFKLNPAAHGNLNLESMDAIRTNAEKQHMHKCTDPNCPSCGTAMREMAKDIPITLARGIFDSTQDDLDEYGQQLTEDERILKHHLGSTFSRRYLTSLSKPAYDELLLTAKTHIVAERYGRHRIRPNARGNSPPGFWDVDMPTTQDMEEREWEMQRRNAELVKERHREAMRKGGKWMFKDE